MSMLSEPPPVAMPCNLSKIPTSLLLFLSGIWETEAQRSRVHQQRWWALKLKFTAMSAQPSTTPPPRSFLANRATNSPAVRSQLGEHYYHPAVYERGEVLGIMRGTNGGALFAGDFSCFQHLKVPCCRKPLTCEQTAMCGLLECCRVQNTSPIGGSPH